MDSFFGIGPFELVFIVIFALIFLGPERLPQVLRQVIDVLRKVRSLTSDITQQLNEEFGDLAELDPRRQIQQALTDEPAKKKPAQTNKATATTPKSTTANKPATPAVKKTTPTTPKKSTTPAAATGEIANGAAKEGSVGEAPAIAGESTTPEATTTPGVQASASEATASETPPEVSQASTTPAEEQISPASAYFAEQKARAENGTHSAAEPTTDAEPTIAPPAAKPAVAPNETEQAQPAHAAQPAAKEDQA